MAQPSRVSPELVLPTPKGKAVATPLASIQSGQQEERQEQHHGAIQPREFGSKRPALEANYTASTAKPPLRTGKVALNFRLDPETHQRLRAASYGTDISIQQICETAVRKYLDHLKY